MTSATLDNAQITGAISSPATNSTNMAKALEAEAKGESSHQLKALHGLRFFAAFCILFSHACTWLGNFKEGTAINLVGEFFAVYGMPLFFVLSGFVIHYNYSRLFGTMRPGWAIVEFLGARFARIYPLFICFFMVGLATDEVLQWYYSHRLNLLLVFAHELTLTQSWVYIVLFGDRLVLDGTFGLSWSLSTEFFFYLSYIALAVHIARLRKPSSTMITAGAMSAIVLVGFLYGDTHRVAIETFAAERMNDHFGKSDHSVFWWFFYYSPYSRVFEFVLGCFTAQVYSSLSVRPATPREVRIGRYLLCGSLICLVTFSLVYLLRPFGSTISEYIAFLRLNYGLAVPIAVVIFCVSRYPATRVAAILSGPLMVLLGELSYSIYAVHTWTLRIFERPTMDFRYGVELEAIFRIVVAIALTFILSTATYRLIEVPTRAWIRKSVARRMQRHFGPREENMLPDGPPYSRLSGVGLVIAFIAMLGLVAAYQFIAVPHFTPYTR